MGLFDSNFFKRKSNISFANNYNVSLANRGTLLDDFPTNTEYKVLAIEVSNITGDASISILGKLSYGGNNSLKVFDVNGNIHDAITTNGLYFADISCIREITIYNNIANENSTNVTLTTNLVDEIPSYVKDIKPIQQLASKEVSITSAERINVWLDDDIDVSSYKYFFVSYIVRNSENQAVSRHVKLTKFLFVKHLNSSQLYNALVATVSENDGYCYSTDWQEVNGLYCGLGVTVSDYVSGDKILVSIYGVR